MNYESKITELVGKLSNIGCCSKRRFKNYIGIAISYQGHWGELIGINTSSQLVKKFIKEEKKLIKNITKLGNTTGRRRESQKIQKNFNSHPDI